MNLAWIAYLLGALSIGAGTIAIASASSRWRSAAVLAALTDDHLPPGDARGLLGAAGVLLLGGGLALGALSRWAAPIFILGTLVETGYLLYVSRVLPPSDEAATRGRRRLIMVMYVYAATTALVLWLESQGVLS
ncbi:MAG TPA: hypothetical protein VHI72_02275 [Hyphomicrobiaceae bacterium]|nr:hypothetical protein [Hyphomicrobiaceae bacterium]